MAKKTINIPTSSSTIIYIQDQDDKDSSQDQFDNLVVNHDSEDADRDASVIEQQEKKKIKKAKKAKKNYLGYLFRRITKFLPAQSRKFYDVGNPKIKMLSQLNQIFLRILKQRKSFNRTHLKLLFEKFNNGDPEAKIVNRKIIQAILKSDVTKTISRRAKFGKYYKKLVQNHIFDLQIEIEKLSTDMLKTAIKQNRTSSSTIKLIQDQDYSDSRDIFDEQLEKCDNIFKLKLKN